MLTATCNETDSTGTVEAIIINEGLRPTFSGQCRELILVV